MSVALIQGDDLTFTIVVKQSGGCYDLTNVTDATLKIPLAAGGEASLVFGGDLLIPTPVNGEVVLTITDTLSQTLKVGDLNLELVLDESSDFKTILLPSGLVVTSRYY